MLRRKLIFFFFHFLFLHIFSIFICLSFTDNKIRKQWFMKIIVFYLVSFLSAPYTNPNTIVFWLLLILTFLIYRIDIGSIYIWFLNYLWILKNFYFTKKSMKL